MSIIALESADGACSIACDDGRTIAIRRCEQSRDSLSWLMQQFDDLSVSTEELQGIACCIGPGGFTGVRVAVGFAQGLGLARSLPVLGVASLDALAQASLRLDADSGLRWVALDARMDQLYAARYRLRADGSLERASALQLLEPEELRDQLGAEERVLGPGFAVYPELFRDQFIAGLGLDAEAVALQARQLPLAQWPDAMALEPIYLRNKVAQTLAERGKA